MKNKEILGRLILWQYALDNTHALLLFSQRAIQGSKQESQKKEAQQFVKDHAKFEVENPEKGIADFLASYPRPFPTIEECIVLNQASIELAITYFCQILKPGNSHEDNISSNSKLFVETHLTKLKDMAFKTEGEKILFDSIREKLEVVRDKMLSHADGSAYMIDYSGKHPNGGPKKLWSQIPLEQLQVMCAQLSKALDSYMESFRQ